MGYSPVSPVRVDTKMGSRGVMRACRVAAGQGSVGQVESRAFHRTGMTQSSP